MELQADLTFESTLGTRVRLTFDEQ